MLAIKVVECWTIELLMALVRLALREVQFVRSENEHLVESVYIVSRSESRDWELSQ